MSNQYFSTEDEYIVQPATVLMHVCLRCGCYVHSGGLNTHTWNHLRQSGGSTIFGKTNIGPKPVIVVERADKPLL